MWKRRIYGPQWRGGHSDPAQGDLCFQKVFTGASAQAWIPAGVTSKVQHAGFTALPTSASEDVMVFCAHWDDKLCLILTCIQELGVAPFLRP